MKPAPFDYARPETPSDALALLSQYGSESKILAGGQSLVPMLNMRLLKPAVLIDISRISKLANIVETDSYLEIGASVKQAELQSYLSSRPGFDLLALILPWVGHYQTRQTGTVCGSLVHSDPSSELPLCLTLLGGEVVINSAKSKRIVSAEKFQKGLLQTDVNETEMVTAVRFPKASNSSRFAFREVSQRHGDFAIVAIAVELNDAGLKIGVGGVADTPSVLSIPYLQDSALDDALNEFAWELGGVDDVHASAKYRRQLVRYLGKTLVAEVTQ